MPSLHSGLINFMGEILFSLKKLNQNKTHLYQNFIRQYRVDLPIPIIKLNI